MAQLVAPAAQEPPAAPVEKPKAEAIPIAEIGVRAEEAKRALVELGKRLAPSDAVLEIERGIPELKQRVDAQVSDASALIDAPSSLVALDELKSSSSNVRQLIQRQQLVLSQRSAALEREVERVRGARERWSATREVAIANDAPREVLAQIAEVEAVIARTAESARERQGAIVQLQGRVAQLEQRLNANLERLDDARHKLVVQVFQADSAPIWSPSALEFLSVREILQRIGASQERDAETIREFCRDRARAIAFHGVLLVGMLIAMFAVRRRVRRRTDDEGLEAVRAIFERPISLSLLLIVLLAAWTLPQPRPLAQLVAIAALAPAVLILRSVLERPVFPLLNALVVLWVVERIRALFAPLPHAPRLIFMLEMLGVVALIIWWARPSRLRAIPSEGASGIFFRVLRVGLRVTLLGASLALCAEAAGYSALGRLIGGGTLFSVYAAVILYGAIRVLDGLVAFLLRVRPLRLLGMVRNHRWLIRTRSMAILKLGALLWWASATLRRFEISDEVWGGIVAAVFAELRIGEAVITLGDLISFGLTIWATFVLSRFVEFLLQEDVYPRVRLRKGVPYAVSALTHYLILLFGFLLAVLALGMDLNRFALLAGAFGVGIGFGLQNVVNNFVSGLILLTERPVEVGDTVAIGDVLGEVQRIGIRSSTVRTWQGAEVIVPNGDLVSQQVINWTHSDRRRRIEIPVGVAYGSDPKRVMAVLLEVMQANPDILSEPEPYVLFTGFGNSSLDFEVRAWTNEFALFQIVRSALCVGFEAALRDAGIEIPFPQRDLHIRSVRAALPTDRAAQAPPDPDAGDREAEA